MTISCDLESLILTIHSGALADDEWIRIGHDLQRAVSADGAGLVRPSGKTDVKWWCRLFGFDPDLVTEYANHWALQDVWYQGAVRTRRLGIGLVNVDSQLIDYHEYKRTAFYNEFLSRMNIDRMMNVILSGPEPDGTYGPAAMSFYRGPGKEPFSREDAALVTRLAPHLAVAAQNYWSAQSSRLLARVHADALDALSSAVFGISLSGHIAFTNRTGEEILRAKRWLQCSVGVLRPAAGVIDATAVERAIHQALRGLSFKLVVTDGFTGTQAILSGAPLLPGRMTVVAPKVMTLVWLTPVVPCIDTAADMAKLFNLSAAEQRLLRRLIAGEDLSGAAQSIKVTVHTARSQLKSIFSKSGLRTQTALLTFAARLATLRSAAQESS